MNGHLELVYLSIHTSLGRQMYEWTDKKTVNKLNVTGSGKMSLKVKIKHNIHSNLTFWPLRLIFLDPVTIMVDCYVLDQRWS